MTTETVSWGESVMTVHMTINTGSEGCHAPEDWYENDVRSCVVNFQVCRHSLPRLATSRHVELTAGTPLLLRA